MVMNKYIYIGTIVNTHGLKGEVRIKSDFKYKDLVFVKGTTIYIGDKLEEKEINSYRPHKDFDMITIKDINYINDVLIYKGLKVYIKRDSLDDELIFNEDLIGLSVYTDKVIGIVNNIIKSKAHDILVLDNKVMIPFIDEFINNIDLDKGIIYINDIKGLI